MKTERLVVVIVDLENNPTDEKSNENTRRKCMGHIFFFLSASVTILQFGNMTDDANKWHF